MPPFLLEKLQEMFPIDRMEEQFKYSKKVCLYGEGYGTRLQKGGGNYREGVSFRLIDAWINGWWVKWDNIVDIAKSLDIKTVPKLYTLEVGVRNQFREEDIVGIESLEDIKDLVIHQKSVVAFDGKKKRLMQKES